MPKSVNDQIRDDLIAHEITLNRVATDMERRIELRLMDLQAELKRLWIEIDPNSATRADVRERRRKKLEEESGKAIKAAYADIGRATRADFGRLVTAEVDNTIETIGEALP